MKETMSTKIDKEVKEHFEEVCIQYDIKKSEVIQTLIENFIRYVDEL